MPSVQSPSVQSILVAALLALSSVTQLSAQIVVQGTTNGAPIGAPPAKIERKIDEKAKAIYDRAIAETAKLKSVQFDAQMRFEGGDAGMAMGMPEEFQAKSRYTIRFVRAETPTADPTAKPAAKSPASPSRNSMRVELLEGASAGRVTISHGGQTVQLDPKAKTLAKCAAGNDGKAEMLMGMASPSCPEWFRGESDRVHMSEPFLLELAGTTTVDDLECDLVKVGREVEIGVVDGPAAGEMHTTKVPLTETIAFARADGLPRQVRMAPPDLGGAGEEMPPMPMPVTTVVGLKTNPAVDDARFSTATPEGYREIEFELPQFGGVIGGEGDAPAAPEMPALAVKVGDAAPDFKLNDIEGKEVTLASLKGKVVLLDFWATWCGPCKAAMPTIQKIADEYKGKDVVVLGVNTFEQKKDAAKEYMANKNFTYRCLLKGDELATKCGISGIPTLLVLRKDGTIASIEVGLSDATGGTIRKAIDAALAK